MKASSWKKERNKRKWREEEPTRFSVDGNVGEGDDGGGGDVVVVLLLLPSVAVVRI